MEDYHWKLYYCKLNNEGSAGCTLHTSHDTMPTVNCPLHTAHCTLHTAHCPLHTVHYTIHTAHCTLYTAHYTLYNDMTRGEDTMSYGQGRKMLQM